MLPRHSIVASPRISPINRTYPLPLQPSSPKPQRPPHCESRVRTHLERAYSRPTPHTTSPMHSVKSFPKKRRKSTALKISTPWRSTQRAPSKRWSNNVRLHLSAFFPAPSPLPSKKKCGSLAYFFKIICYSGSERHDGHLDARSRFRHPRCRRSDVLCRDHEVRRLASQFLRKREGEPLQYHY